MKDKDKTKDQLIKELVEIRPRIAELERMETEYKQSVEALRESEEKSRLLLDSTGEGIYGVDLEGNCTFSNPACLRILGYGDVGDLLGKNMHEIIHHTRHDGTPYPEEECRIYQAFRQGEGTHVDDEVLWRADSTSFPAEYWSFPIRQDGELVGSVVTFVDISERKQVMEELSKSEALYRTLAESSPDCIKLLDIEGRVVTCNEGALKVLGLDSKEELIGKQIVPSFPEEYQLAVAGAIENAIQGKTVRVQTQAPAPNGDMRWWDDAFMPVFGEDSRVTNILFIGRDITEHKWIEEELRKHRDYLEELVEMRTAELQKTVKELKLEIADRKRAEDAISQLKEFNENVVHSIQDGLVVFDRDVRITFWNKAMEEISGRSAEEVLGQVFYDIFPHLIEKGANGPHKSVIKGETVVQTNVPYLTPEGEARYTNQKYLPLKGVSRELTGILVIVEDVTEMLQFEERVTKLQHEIEQRKFVEIAKGILMRELDLSEAASHRFIQKKSRDERARVWDVAKRVIESFGSLEERNKIT